MENYFKYNSKPPKEWKTTFQTLFNIAVDIFKRTMRKFTFFLKKTKKTTQ